MKILLIMFASLISAGYLSAEQSDVNMTQEKSDQVPNMNMDENNAAYAHGDRGRHGFHRGRRGHHGHHRGWRGYGYGYGGYYPHYNYYGYYPSYGYNYSYPGYGYGFAPPVEELAPIVEQVYEPVVQKVPVYQKHIKVITPVIQTEKVPVNISQTVRGKAIRGPDLVPGRGPAPDEGGANPRGFNMEGGRMPPTNNE